mmetsp:Transcript_5899/g.6801  ORF Transcript_5899/g.6801 Transcript_5899/m.6801 type:complete len:84 (-) Transcript_5899:226-477(-)
MYSGRSKWPTIESSLNCHQSMDEKFKGKWRDGMTHGASVLTKATCFDELLGEAIGLTLFCPFSITNCGFHGKMLLLPAFGFVN